MAMGVLLSPAMRWLPAIAGCANWRPPKKRKSKRKIKIRKRSKSRSKSKNRALAGPSYSAVL
jgi:hypothetical protein